MCQLSNVKDPVTVQSSATLAAHKPFLRQIAILWTYLKCKRSATSRRQIGYLLQLWLPHRPFLLHGSCSMSIFSKNATLWTELTWYVSAK